MINKMNYKKIFWMNVLFAILWVLFCLLSFATDIDYVEHSLTHKILTFLIQLFILATSIITATHLYKSNTKSLGKLAIFGNCCCIILTIGYLITITYFQPSILTSMNFLILLFVYSIFILPFAINIKTLRNSYK